MVHHQLAVDVFEDRAVARGVRHREMQRRLQLLLPGESTRRDHEAGRLHRIDGLLNGCEIVEHVLRPDRDRHTGLAAVPFGVFRFGKPEEVRGQPRSFMGISRFLSYRSLCSRRSPVLLTRNTTSIRAASCAQPRAARERGFDLAFRRARSRGSAAGFDRARGERDARHSRATRSARNTFNSD